MQIAQSYDQQEVFNVLSTRRLQPEVNPIEGTSSPSGRIFRVRGREVFVSRRWTLRDGIDTCIIDLSSPGTGYVASRNGHVVESFVTNRDGATAPLSAMDEETLYNHFAKIVERTIVAALIDNPFQPQVEIIRPTAAAEPKKELRVA